MHKHAGHAAYFLRNTTQHLYFTATYYYGNGHGALLYPAARHYRAFVLLSPPLYDSPLDLLM